MELFINSLILILVVVNCIIGFEKQKTYEKLMDCFKSTCRTYEDRIELLQKSIEEKGKNVK